MIDIQNVNADDTLLRKHQLKMLEMLDYVDKVCRRNNIDYWLSGGTLLGAVRHQGFIPWDDDLDIVLLKKDLEKLHKLLLTDKDSPYQLQANDTDAFYIAPYEKLRIPHTEIKENNDNDKYYRFRGIYIDLFFLEPALLISHAISNKFQRLLLRFANLGNFRGKQLMLRSSFLFLHKILYPCLSHLSFLFNRNKLSYPLGSFFSTQFERGWIYPLRELDFEGRKYLAPGNYDAILTAQYGDYMKYPSLDQIEFHTCCVKFEE